MRCCREWELVERTGKEKRRRSGNNGWKNDSTHRGGFCSLFFAMLEFCNLFAAVNPGDVTLDPDFWCGMAECWFA